MGQNYRDIVNRINQLNILHRIFIHRAAYDNGMFPGQLPILEYVIEHDMCTQKELADMLQVSSPSIATSIKRMQKTGLLSKTASEDDLRCNRISITAKGKQLAGESRIAFDRIDERMFTGFNQDECEALCVYLDRLINNLSTSEFKDKTFFAMLNTMKAEKGLHAEQDPDSLSGLSHDLEHSHNHNQDHSRDIGLDLNRDLDLAREPEYGPNPELEGV